MCISNGTLKFVAKIKGSVYVPLLIHSTLATISYRPIIFFFCSLCKTQKDLPLSW